MKDEQLKILHKAIEKYGIDSQIDMVIEEMSELTKALLKHRRVINQYGGSTKEQLRHNIYEEKQVNEEIADVLIMLNQLLIIYNKTDVEEYICEKIQRLEGRLCE